MAWVRDFYNTKSTWFGPTGIFAEHRARAAEIERLCGPGPKRILELGAGAGGTAAAMAELGHSVVAVEVSPVRAAFARELAGLGRRSLTVVEGDFYAVELQGRFDVVCYWDGFGVGTDTDQRRLLRRVTKEWLGERGVMLLDVFSPLFWEARAGRVETVDRVWRQVDGEIRTVALEVPVKTRYDFDPIASRYISEWWPIRRRQQAVKESVRCYSPVDFLLLIEGTGLTADLFEANGERLETQVDNRGVANLLSTTRSYRVRLVRCEDEGAKGARPQHEGLDSREPEDEACPYSAGAQYRTARTSPVLRVRRT